MGDKQSKDGHQGTCNYSLGTNHLIFNWETVIRKEEMIMGHCGPIITTFNGPFQCSLGKN
jgi:hypothetical protein